jgi:hypothetical protein
MSLTKTEYAVHRISTSTGQVKSKHGPYDDLSSAETQQRGGERKSAGDGRADEEQYIIMERDVTPWQRVPKRCPDWPEDD